MRSCLVLALLGISCSTIAGTPANTIVERRNVPLAITVYSPQKVHEVKVRQRIMVSTLVLTPAVIQSFDRSRTSLGLEIKVTNPSGFVNAAGGTIVFTADGKRIGEYPRQWTVTTGWSTSSETSIEDVELLHKLTLVQNRFLQSEIE